MALLAMCCFCVSLRRACFVFSVSTLIYYAAIVAAVTLHLQTISMSPGLVAFSLVMMLLYSICVISSILMLIGLCVESKHMLLPWITSVSLTSPLNILFDAMNPSESGPESVNTLITESLMFLLSVYGVVIVISQYQEYEAGRGTADYYNRFQPQTKSDVTGFRPDLEKGIGPCDRTEGRSLSRVSESHISRQTSLSSNSSDLKGKEESQSSALFTVEKYSRVVAANEETPLIIEGVDGTQASLKADLRNPLQ